MKLKLVIALNAGVPTILYAGHDGGAAQAAWKAGKTAHQQIAIGDTTAFRSRSNKSLPAPAPAKTSTRKTPRTAKK